MRTKLNLDFALQHFKRNELAMAQEIANANKNYFVKSFTKQSWNGTNWKQVQRRIPGTPAYKYPTKKGLTRRTKPILIGKGFLRREVSKSTKSVTTRRIKFEVNLPYADVHNDGTNTIARRQYMGWNKDIDKINKGIIKKYQLRSLNAPNK